MNIYCDVQAPNLISGSLNSGTSKKYNNNQLKTHQNAQQKTPRAQSLWLLAALSYRLLVGHPLIKAQYELWGWGRGCCRKSPRESKAKHLATRRGDLMLPARLPASPSSFTFSQTLLKAVVGGAARGGRGDEAVAENCCC